MIFNHNRIINNKEKASKNFANYDFLIREASSRLAEKLDFVKASFKNALILGCYQGASSDYFTNNDKIANFICVDDSKGMLKNSKNYKLCSLENYFENIAPNSVDIVISSMFLQNANDIKSVFKNAHNVLKKDGALLITVPSVGTLKELEDVLLKVDLETNNAFVPRIHPFLELKQTANLIHEIGFKDVSSDRDILEIMYKDAKSLFKDLKGMGARSAILSKIPISKSNFYKIESLLQEQKEENNHFKITVELCNFIAWK